MKKTPSPSISGPVLPYPQGAQASWQMAITEKTVLHGRLKIVWTCISTQLSNVKWRHLQTYSPLSSKTHQSYLRAPRASGLQPHYLHTEASGGDDLQQGGCPPLAPARVRVLQEGSQSPKGLRWWRGKRAQKKKGKNWRSHSQLMQEQPTETVATYTIKTH